MQTIPLLGKCPPPASYPTTTIVLSSTQDSKQMDYLVKVHLMPQRCQ